MSNEKSGTLNVNKCVVGAAGFSVLALVLIWGSPIVFSAVDAAIRWGVGIWSDFLQGSEYSTQMALSSGAVGVGCCVYLVCWLHGVNQEYERREEVGESTETVGVSVLRLVGLLLLGMTLFGLCAVGMEAMENAVWGFWAGFLALPALFLALLVIWAMATATI